MLLMKSIEQSVLKNFSRLSVQERQNEIEKLTGINLETAIRQASSLELSDRLVENAVGSISIPLGIATNFIINGQEVLVPMATEEPSVIAAACNAARMVRSGGGFICEHDPSIMEVQIEIRNSAPGSYERLISAKNDILEAANKAQPGLVAVGGGARDLTIRECVGNKERTVLHLAVDCVDAMGANSVNTMAEKLSEMIASISEGQIGLRILTNLADKRLVRASVSIPVEAMKRGRYSGEAVSEGVVKAWEFAAADPYRAATHNKGIFNGIDAVLIASGNDWRAVEAGGHAFAALRGGGYSPLSSWKIKEGKLIGELIMPMAVGIVGGAANAHPTAQACIKLMGIEKAKDLGCIAGAVGLACNLAALAALSSEGIQFGHMRLHARRQTK